MQSVFEAAGVSEGLRRLAHAWHKRVMTDNVVPNAFSHGFHPQHVERLAAYWAEALGGPTMHSIVWNQDHRLNMHSVKRSCEMTRRAIACLELALADRTRQ